MATVGGSIQALSLDGRNFAVASDAEAQIKLGGFENEVLSNGDGTARLIKTRVPLSIDSIMVEIDHARGDLQFIQELSNRNDYFPIFIILSGGIIYQATAQIVGETQTSSQTSHASISLMGPGVLTRQ